MVMKQSLAQEVYNHLLSKLLSGELSPGELFDRRSVAAEMEMSIAPVQEAMLRLEKEGFLKVIPRKATQVVLLNQKDFEGLYTLREAIECQAARLYCGSIIKSNMPALVKQAKQINELPYTSIDHWKVEMGFHTSLIELVDCHIVLDVFENVIRRMVFHWANMLLSTGKEKPAAHHLELLKKLETDNPDEAENAMRSHIMQAKKDWLNEAGNNLYKTLSVKLL